jgi:hypothetical protein
MAVGVLAVLGAACQPTPQLQLTTAIDQTGTYDVLTKAVSLRVTVTCSRPATVYVTRAQLVLEGSGPVVVTTRDLDPVVSSGNFAAIDCPGPAGRAATTWWQWPGDPPGTGGYTIWVSVGTLGLLGSPNTAGATGSATVRFSKVLCWFGLSNPCTPV